MIREAFAKFELLSEKSDAERNDPCGGKCEFIRRIMMTHGKPKYLKMKVVPNLKGKTIGVFSFNNIEINSQVQTDAIHYYRNLLRKSTTMFLKSMTLNPGGCISST